MAVRRTPLSSTTRLTGTFAATGSLPFATSDAAAVTLQSGTALVVGGLSGTTSLANAALYNPAHGTFAHDALAPGGAKRWVDGRSFRMDPCSTPVARPKSTVTPSSDVFRYTSSGWSYAAALLAPQADGTLTLIGGGLVLAAGGYSSTELSESLLSETFFAGVPPSLSGPTSDNVTVGNRGIASVRGDGKSDADGLGGWGVAERSWRSRPVGSHRRDRRAPKRHRRRLHSPDLGVERCRRESHHHGDVRGVARAPSRLPDSDGEWPSVRLRRCRVPYPLTREWPP